MIYGRKGMEIQEETWTHVLSRPYFSFLYPVFIHFAFIHSIFYFIDFFLGFHIFLSRALHLAR